MLSYAQFHYDNLKAPWTTGLVYHLTSTYQRLDATVHLLDDMSISTYVYQTLDAASLILAPLGLDFIPDLTGLVYASFIDKDGTQAGTYGVSLLAVGYFQYLSMANKYAYKSYKAIGMLDEAGNVVSVSTKLDNYVPKINEKQLSTIVAKSDAEAAAVLKQDLPYYYVGGGRIGKVSGVGNAFRGITKTQFFETVAEFKIPSNGLLGDQAWDLWKAEKWTELETLFKNNNLNKSGTTIWPPNRGFIDVVPEPLTVGKEIDRYGGYIDNVDGLYKDKGTFASPKGASFESRALTPETINKPYVKYKVVKEIPGVNKGQAIPWFGQKGKGIQYELPESIDDLLKGGYIVKIRDSWSGYSKIFKASADEVLEATSKISKHRLTAGNGGNYGYLEGKVNNISVDSKFWRSTSITVAEREVHIFDAIIAQRTNGKEWLRITDSEYRMLNKLASDLGAVKGGKYPNITGELKIISENPYCSSCTGIIQQFNDMFPNVNLILIDGAK